MSFYDLGSGNLNIFIILITLHIGKADEIGVFKVFFKYPDGKIENGRRDFSDFLKKKSTLKSYI